LVNRLLLVLGAAVVLAPAAAAAPQAYPLGVYVLSVHDLNVGARTAGVDMWLWSLSANKARPLETVELVNANRAIRSLGSTQPRPPGAWSQEKVSGTFRQIWDFRNFPFDQQTVEVVLEEGVEDASSFVYRVDEQASSYQEEMELPGWRITGFDVRRISQPYETTFGDPLLAGRGGSDYSRVVAEVHLKREAIVTTFFKLAAPLYAAVLMALATFFIPLESLQELGARMGLLAAALFAAVLNMRDASDTIGAETGLSLLDQIHIAAFVLIIAATVIGIRSRLRVEHGVDPDRIRRFDHRSFAVASTLFVAVNVALIAVAAAAA
jgi:hypothetical protein